MRAIEGALCTGTRGAGGGVRGQAGWGEWRGNEWDLAIRLYHLKLQAGEPGAANRVICLVSVTRLCLAGAVCVWIPTLTHVTPRRSHGYRLRTPRRRL